MVSIQEINKVYKNGLFSLLHCNIRSLNKNADALCALLGEHVFEYNVVALSET